MQSGRSLLLPPPPQSHKRQEACLHTVCPCGRGPIQCSRSVVSMIRRIWAISMAPLACFGSPDTGINRNVGMLRTRFFLVHIHLIHADLPGIFFGQRLHNRPHHPAGTAPRGVKIDYGGQVALVFPFRIGPEVINPRLEFRCRQFDCFHSMLFFSRRRLPAEAAMPSICATAVPILAFRIVFRPRLYSITQKSEISYAPATSGDRQR